MKQRNDICIKVYFPKEEFIEVVKHAEEAAKRPRGLKTEVLKKNGFSGQTVPNTKGIARYLKWLDSEWYHSIRAKQLQEQAEIEKQEKELADRKAKAGM